MTELTLRRIAKLLDHALLKPTLTEAELWQGCTFARAHQVASVCIVPFAVRRCAELLFESGVAPSTTVGFPHGAHTRRQKVSEARESLDDGATELDMVVNINQVLSGNFAAVRQEIEAVLPEVGVKASGGIRTLDQVLECEALGCSRVGTTSTASILDEIARHREQPRGSEALSSGVRASVPERPDARARPRGY